MKRIHTDSRKFATLFKQTNMRTLNRAFNDNHAIAGSSAKALAVLRLQPVSAAVFTVLIGLITGSAYAQSAKNVVAVTAACDTTGATFRTPEGVFVEALNSKNSNLPVAADLGLWNQSKGLPFGSNILLTASEVKAPADGRSVLKLDIKAYDAAGKQITTPVKLLVETNLGRLSTGGNTQQHSALEIATKTGQACLNLVAPTVAGSSNVRVSSGAVKVQGTVDFVPDLRPMLVVGLVQGGLSLTKFKKDVLTPNVVTTDFSEELRNLEKTTESDDGTNRKTIAGRVALFVKGTVKGEYLLTAAVDTDKITKQKLFRDIDPNAFYPIYGDASVKNFDAQSTSRLYVRVDKDKNYLLYGDYTTASIDESNKLASYSRSVTGAKTHFENDSVKINLWVAKDTLRAFVDEQPGQGISGPYAVGQPNAVVNSEKVELLVRDRNQNSVILKRELLVRFVDYDFEPFSGKMLFRKPIPSVDENLNPVSIRTTYEVDEGGEKFWVGGVDGKFTMGPVSVGASYATDKNKISPYELAGVNAELKLGDKTYIVAEVAKSKGTQFYNQSIESITQQNTGYSSALGGVIPNKVEQSGQAVRVEIRHDGEELQARAFVSKADAGFQNSNAGISAGREEVGVSATLKVSKELTIKSEATYTKDFLTSSKRDAGSLGASYRLNDTLMIDVSVNKVKEVGTVGALSVESTQNGLSSVQGLGWSNGGFGLDGGGLLNPVNASNPSTGPAINNEYTSLKARLTGKVADEVSIYGEYERATDDTGRQRSAVGAEYRINDKSRVYGRYEFENTLAGASNGISLSGTNTRTSVIGIDAEYMKDGQLFSEYRLSGSQNGLDGSAAIGVRNQWNIAEGLTISTSAERQALRPIDGKKNDAVAMSLGALYSANANYKFGGRVEYRTSRSTDQWNLTATYDRKLDANWSAIARELYIYSHDRWGTGNGDQKQNRFQLGVAYRDTQSGQLNGLARMEYRTDRSNALTDMKDSKTTIFSLQTNYHPLRAITVNAQAAFKSVNETFDKVDTKWKGTLLSGRFTYDINDRLDASILASRNWGTGGAVSGYGAELGTRVIDNMWFGVSYSKGHFLDTELFSSNASWTGWHIRLKYKFE
jgi:hypothetical protein